MKKLIAGAGLGAAVAIGSLVGAGTASADSSYDNYRYLQGLNNNGISVDDVSEALSYGQSICRNLDYGNSALQEQHRVYQNSPANFTWQNAYNYVGVAVTYLCPYHSGDVYAPVSY